MTTNIARLREKVAKAQRELQEANKKADTRRKIILGSCILSAVKQGSLGQDWVNKLLEKFVTRKSDREFMGLSPLGNSHSNNPPPPPHQEGE